MSGTTMSSKPSTASSGQKVSMFASKSGFVIPKNKLSGSLVPIFRGGKKLRGSDDFDGESTKQVQRKTKWGRDVTQDAAVRRGRALAYQTRVDQITQQLKSSVSEAEDDINSIYAAQTSDEESSRLQIDSEKVEPLELEKREIIGEILKLNPSYKPSPNYKPLLKETRVPIPVKEYPEYNFVGLIYGPGSDNQKRLEKETGAKIQVYGTKAETGEKIEIKSSGGNEVYGAYAEIDVHISAETFEKIDAAVSVIELLITSVSGNLAAASTTSNLASGNNASVSSQGQVSTTTSDLVPSAVVQPVAGPTQMPPQGQFKYTGPWFPSGPAGTPMYLPGSIPPNSSTPIVNNPAHLSTSPFKPLNMPSLFGPIPVPIAGFNSTFQAPSPFLPRPHPSTQVPQHAYMAQTSSAPIGPQGNPSAMAYQPFSAQPKVSTPFSSTGSQMPPMGSPGINRPVMPLLSQPALAATGSSTLWSSGPPAITPASAGFNNTGQMAPTMVSPHRPQPLVPQPGVSSTLLSTTITASTFPPGPSTQFSNTPPNHPTLAPGFASVPWPHMGFPPTISASVSPTPVPAPAANSFVRPTVGSASVPSIGPSVSLSQPMQSGIPTSVSRSTPNFTPVKAPSSGDFTFQPNRPHNPTSQTVTMLNSHSATQNALPTSPMMQPPAPQALSSRLPAHNFPPQPVNQVFSRLQVVGDHMGQPQSHISAVSFGRNPTAVSVPARLPTFSDTSPAARNQNLHMRPRNFIPPPQMPNLPGPFLPRPGNLVQQNYPVHTNWSVNNPSFTSGKSASGPSEQQLYDPFSPTSMSIASEQQLGNATKIRKQENK